MDITEALAKYPGACPYPVGDSEALNAQILTLMRSGAKTATCDAWSTYENGTEDLPVVGRVDIALDWAGNPNLATRTPEVLRIPFEEMHEDMVHAQGEFRDLAHWRPGYEACLTRAGRFSPNVALTFERFEVVEDFEQ